MTNNLNQNFFSLTPDEVLASVERAGYEATGLCYALNSLENRVYEVEIEERRRVIAKFYRPGRWSRETILDEHRLLAALKEAEIPVCAPLPFPDKDTLHSTPDGIHFALFPKGGGRNPDELMGDDYPQLGRLLGRIHNVSASLDLKHRPPLSPQTYGDGCLEIILGRDVLPQSVKARYVDAVARLVAAGEARFRDVETFVTHGDCHRANLLKGRDGWFFLDFDDAVIAPAVQDIWLLLPARPAECPKEVEEMIKGYEQFRSFPHRSLRLIEVLRGLRYIRYAAWIADRWDDPSFPRAFPHFGTEVYWQGQLNDIYEQLCILDDEAQREGWN